MNKNSEQYAIESTLIEQVTQRYNAARKYRDEWAQIWQECYDYALPQRGGFTMDLAPGKARHGRIYDATAIDAADQLASSMLAHLTPCWSQWFGLVPGTDLTPQEAQDIAPVLEKAGKIIQSHFDHSNFAVEIHQCYLDLVVGGTASLIFDEADAGGLTAFNFSAIPLTQIVLEEGGNGSLDAAYRIIPMSVAMMIEKYPSAQIPPDVMKQSVRDPQTKFKVLEAVMPKGLVYEYVALLLECKGKPVVLQAGEFTHSPVISFRWMKSPGEIYGRSPIMKALPDIKTANKVVELILKNASIAVTGIWQADDDGVLNPANIELSPGSIIPKAVGSKGLQPLEMPGRFDISQLMLDSLQSRIRHALMADKFAPISSPRMTATEVAERAAEMSVMLGATYGRLQSELLTPLIRRAYSILRRRGEVPDLSIDGRLVAIDYRSPLAAAQKNRNVQNTLSWLSAVAAMGAGASEAVNLPQAARFLGEALAVPGHLMKNIDVTTDVGSEGQ